MRFEGTIKYWNDERGFGFIEPTKGGPQVFVHIKAFVSHDGRPERDLHVYYDVESGPHGKIRATNVYPVQVGRQSLIGSLKEPLQRGVFTLFTLPVFMTAYAVVHVMWSPPLIIAALYAGVSVFTFFVYAVDKAAAKRQARRIPENTLHLLALTCGWPGALLAQQILRHKSSKAEFRAVFWGTVVLNVVAFVFLSSPVARSFCAAQLRQLYAPSRSAVRGYER